MGQVEKASILSRIEQLRVSAIIRTRDADVAERAMAAAVEGGFRMIEFTLTTPDAMALIARFARDDRLLVGAGTVLSVGDARAAADAGARFLVSPVCDPEVIRAAHALDTVSVPGTFTATEMYTADRCGADLVKLFPAPADVAGYVTAVLGPLPHLRIFPTAGITVENFVDVLRAGAFGVGFVRPLFVPEDLAREDYGAIRRRAADIIGRLPKV